MVRYFIYLLALSFQVSGAALLIGNIKTKMSIVAGQAFKTSIIPQVKNGVIQNYEQIKQAMKSAFANKVALFMILLGYLFSLCGKVVDEYWIYSVSVVLILICVEYFGARKIIDLHIEKINFTKVKVEDIQLPKDTIIMDMTDKSTDNDSEINEDISINKKIGILTKCANVDGPFEEEYRKIEKIYSGFSKKNQAMLYNHYMNLNHLEQDKQTVSSLIRLITPILTIMLNCFILSFNLISAPSMIQYYSFVLSHLEYSDDVIDAISYSYDYLRLIIYVILALIIIVMLAYCIDEISIFLRNKYIKKQIFISNIIKIINDKNIEG